MKARALHNEHVRLWGERAVSFQTFKNRLYMSRWPEERAVNTPNAPTKKDPPAKRDPADIIDRVFDDCFVEAAAGVRG